MLTAAGKVRGNAAQRQPGPTVSTGGVLDWYMRHGGISAIILTGLLLLATMAGLAATIAMIDGLKRVWWFGHIFLRRSEIYGFAMLCTILSTWLVLGQLISFLAVGQHRKTEIILGFFSPGLIAAYFFEFSAGRDGASALCTRWKTENDPAQPQRDVHALHKLGLELRREFVDLILDNYGSRSYAFSSVLFTAASMIVLFIAFSGGISYAEFLTAAPPKGMDATLPPPTAFLGLRLDLVSIAAIFGAFTYVAVDAVTRNRQWTFHPSDFSWYTIRLIFAVPLGQAIALTWTGHSTTASGLGAATGAFLAFVVSMFSFEALTSMLGGIAIRTGVLPPNAPTERDDVVLSLPGVDQLTAQALNREGISTVLQLVAVDPIRLSIRTGLAFEYVLDLIDSAVLWRCLGSNLAIASRFGLWGATDIHRLLQEEWDARVHDLEQKVAKHEAARDDPSASAARDDLATFKKGTPADLALEPTERLKTLLNAMAAASTAASRLGSRSGLELTFDGLREVFSRLWRDRYVGFLAELTA